MAKNRYLPDSDGARPSFLQNFAQKLPAHATAFNNLLRNGFAYTSAIGQDLGTIGEEKSPPDPASSQPRLSLRLVNGHHKDDSRIGQWNSTVQTPVGG